MEASPQYLMSRDSTTPVATILRLKEPTTPEPTTRAEVTDRGRRDIFVYQIHRRCRLNYKHFETCGNCCRVRYGEINSRHVDLRRISAVRNVKFVQQFFCQWRMTRISLRMVSLPCRRLTLGERACVAK